MVCTYKFIGTDGESITITGKPAFKAYLASGGLLHLLPERAAQAGFKRTPVASAVASQTYPQTAMVQRVANTLASTWKNKPEVIFYDSLQDSSIPEFVRKVDAEQRAAGATGAPEGFHINGKVYIWNGLKTERDVVRVMQHEALGHYGLRGLYGQALKPVLDQIVALRRAEVIKRARQYGLVKKGVDVTKASDAEMWAAMTDDHKTQAAEEVLAFMAQTSPNIGFVRRAIAAIRTWIRQNIPALANIELSDAEIIRDFLLPARAFVQQGAEAGQAMRDGASFSRAPAVDSDAFKRWFGDSKIVNDDGTPKLMYHGTSKDFNEFDVTRSPHKDMPAIGAIFLTDDPKFANDFTYSEGNGPIGGNIMPLYVRAENTFDFDNAEHRAKVIDDVIEKTPIYRNAPDRASMRKVLDESIEKKDGTANWGTIENETFLNVLKEHGFDSFYVRENSKKNLGVFSNTQVKSAIGNNGQYDGTNPDIRFSRSPEAEPIGLTPPEQGFLRRTQANFQDNNNRIKEVQKRISEVTGKAVPEYADYYRAEENRAGRIAARLEDFREKMRAPLVERIAKSGHTLEQVEELAHAMHAQERNESSGKLHPEDSDFFKAIDDHSIVGASGMSTDKANEIIERAKADATLHKHVADLRKIARAALDIKLAAERITQEDYDTIVKAYDFYVPLKGDGEYGPNIKRAIGHGERDEHIMENVMRDYEQAVVSSERNLARQAFLQLVLQNPDPDLWTVGVAPKGRYIAGQSYNVYKDGQVVAEFDSEAKARSFVDGRMDNYASYTIEIERGKFTVERDGKPVAYLDSHSKAEKYIESVKELAGKLEIKATGERVKEFVKPLQDNELPVYVNGQLVRIQMKDETLAKQMRPLDQAQMGFVLEKMRDLNRWFSRVYTAYSPTFLITNPLRDAGTGTVTMLGNQGAGVAAKAWTKYPSAIKALLSYARTGKEPNTETGKMLKEYRMAGGKTGASHMSDLEKQGEELTRLFDDAYGATGYLADKKYGKAALVGSRKILGGLAHVFEVMNQATENALRLSLYMTLREQGASTSEAAQAAKNVTVNFDRKGKQTDAMGALYLFFNPAVQGTANAMRALAKGDHKKQAWAALGLLTALGMYAAGQGIDDDEDRWLGEGWENRSKKLVLNIGGHKITVPMSLEFAPFYAVGVALEEARRGKSKPMESAGRLVSSFIDAYVPFKGLYSYDSDNKPLDAAIAFVPTALRSTMVEPAVNRNSFGSKIVPESDFTKDRPDNLKMNRNTKGTVFDSLAQGIASGGEMLGEGRYENGLTKVSPETLKHYWRTFTGGLGTFLGDTASLGSMAVQDAGAIEMGDVPVVKAFAKGQDVAPIRGRYYDLTKDARAVAEEFKQAKKAGDDEAMDAIESRPDKAELLGLDRMIKKTNKAAGAIRDEMADINADKTMPLGEKRKQLKELEREEEAIYRDAIDAFKK